MTAGRHKKLFPSLYSCNPQPHRRWMHFGTPRWLTATCDVITMPTAMGLKASVTMLYCTEWNVRNAINDPNTRRGQLHPITVPPHSSFPIPFPSPINTLLPCTISPYLICHIEKSFHHKLHIWFITLFCSFPHHSGNRVSSGHALL